MGDGGRPARSRDSHAPKLTSSFRSSPVAGSKTIAWIRGEVNGNSSFLYVRIRRLCTEGFLNSLRHGVRAAPVSSFLMGAATSSC
jgi:hypothetical protein|eukprot:COSAG06_NODE_3066_length_5900_cov_19.446241_4_plen_85_part_00